MLAMLHGCHHYKEVCVVGDADGDGVKVVGIFVKQLAEVCKSLGVGVHVQHLLALLALKVHVAQGNYVHHVCLGELADVLLSSVADAYVGNLHFFALGLLGFL